MEAAMTRLENAEQLFRRLNADNRGLLLTYFETALAAENSVKKALDVTARTGQDRAYEETGEAPRKNPQAGRRDETGE
jgi:hypothetical protein